MKLVYLPTTIINIKGSTFVSTLIKALEHVRGNTLENTTNKQRDTTEMLEVGGVIKKAKET